MTKRRSVIGLLLLALALVWNGSQKAVSQQGNEPTQTLVIGYPTQGIIINGSGTRYTGVIYVKIYPASESLVKKYGSGPIASAELAASQRDVRQLPLGNYEVHYAMRTGGELKTFILKDVILRADRANALTVEMNSDAQTTVIGGDMTARQMSESIRQLQAEAASLKSDIAELKRK
ncbi:MAG: hypothetical protein IT210_03140 [Armatimonadetes bacterium]|nr:hypothetical protein [Armatimonadota bacterium]